MDKYKLVDELVKALELTPTEIVRYWQNSGRIQPALFCKSQAKSRKTKSKQTAKPEPEPKPELKRRNLNFMTESDIFEVFKRIIAEQAGVDEDDILRGSNLVCLGVDSLDFVEITMMLEKTFGITIPDEDVNDKMTVQDILDYLVERKVMINGGVPIIS
jgi:acyl carrier protein